MNSDEIVTKSAFKMRGPAARTKMFFWAVLLLPVFSCELVDSGDWGSYGGSYGGTDDERRAATTCRDYAERQRLNVQRVLSSQSLGAGNDYEVHLRVQRGGRSDDVTCYTDVRTGSTRIAEGSSYGGTDDERRAATTCRDYAERQRLNVQRVLSSQSLGAGNDYEVHLRVQRGGRSDDVTCYTDVRTGSTRIAEGSSYGGTDDERRAVATCRDYAERQRLNVQRVLSSQSRGAGNDYEVHLRVQRGGRSDDVTCYTDVRTGSTRIAE